MAKRTKKISINITEDQFKLLEWLASHYRRSVSELAALIVMDNARLLYAETHTSATLTPIKFIPSKSLDEND